MPIILKCVVCGNEFLEDDAPKKENGAVCLDAFGYSWCKECTEQFDTKEEINHGK